MVQLGHFKREKNVQPIAGCITWRNQQMSRQAANELSSKAICA